MGEHIDAFSLTAHYLEVYFKEQLVSKATGFFVKRKDTVYLITNWHVVTGLNSETKEALGDGPYSGYQPTSIKTKLLKSGGEFIEWEDFQIEISDEEYNIKWIEHPIHMNKVDVVAIPVNIPPNLYVEFVEEHIEPFNQDTIITVSEELYILGFPFGLNAGEQFPIWKRGSVASEPILNINGLPKMYIDTATREGMSGSPVILKRKRPVTIVDNDGRLSRNFNKFVGVYSGRIGGNDELKAQLGIVWKANVIDEIINNE